MAEDVQTGGEAATAAAASKTLARPPYGLGRSAKDFHIRMEEALSKKKQDDVLSFSESEEEAEGLDIEREVLAKNITASLKQRWPD